MFPILLLLVLGAAVALRYGAFGERPRAVLRAALRYALILGGIGFSIGFFGPLVWAPEANQGPLLGIFITGPLGFVIGLVGGVILELRRGSRAGA